jgi:hypothetical protein
MPLQHRNFRYFYAIITPSVTGLLSVGNGKKGRPIAAGPTARQGGVQGQKEEVVGRVQNHEQSHCQEVRPEMRHMQNDQHEPRVVQQVKARKYQIRIRTSTTTNCTDLYRIKFINQYQLYHTHQMKR